MYVTVDFHRVDASSNVGSLSLLLQHTPAAYSSDKSPAEQGRRNHSSDNVSLSFLRTMSIVESLKELEAALRDTPVPTLGECHAEESNYVEQFKAFRGMTDEADILSDVLSGHLCDMLEAHSPSKELKVLSVGCGDGVLDNIILSKVLANCPTAKINYTGLDTNAQFCTESEERLQPLPIAKKFICDSFEKVDAGNLGTFDFIYLVHVHYYFQDQQSAFRKARRLLSSEGKCVAIVSPPNLHTNLVTPFKKHEGRPDVQTMDNAVKALEDSGIAYQLQDLCTKLYLSSCFKDEWNSDISRFVLDFISGTKMSKYPDNIPKLCISYLMTATADGPEEFVLPLQLQVVCFKA